MRKLAAVLAADIVGYSRLMGADEEQTLAALRQFRAEVFGPTVAGQTGKIIKSMGDGWLVLFESAVDAVGCALMLQDRLAGHGVIKLRIGVHIGDIAQEDEDIFGDAVNVAARLQEIAEQGGVTISDAIYGSLDGTLVPSFNDGGVRELKNIDRAIQTWHRALDGPGTPSNHKRRSACSAGMGFPSLKIEPVTTSDTRSDVRELAESLTSDLETYLNSAEWLLSKTNLEGTSQDYSLRAVLRARQDRLRLEARLSGAGGESLWTEKLDGDLADSFDWQDTVGEAIASNVLGRIRDAERQKLAASPIPDRSAAECLLSGLLDWNIADPQAVTHSLRLLQAAIQREPDNVMALTLAVSHLFSASACGYTDAIEEFLPLADEWLQRALSHPSLDVAEELCLACVKFRGTVDAAELRAAINRALRQSPFSAHVLAWAGWGWLWLGEPQQALDCFQKFGRLGRLSHYSEAVSGGFALACVQAGRDKAAIDHIENSLKTTRVHPTMSRALAAAYAHLGRSDEATAAIEQLLSLIPGETISAIRKRAKYAESPATRRYFEGLRMAGLPE